MRVPVLKMKMLTAIFLTILFPALALGADITIQWDANTEPDLAGYYVYQANRMGDTTTSWQRITPTLVTETSFVVTGLDDGNYAWLVTAVDTQGNESFVSNMVERYDRTPPSSPINLRK